MKLNDALLNWLQIKLVAEERKDDQAAQQTVDFFAEVLREDHRLTQFEIESVDEDRIHLRYEMDGDWKKKWFDREHAEQLVRSLDDPRNSQCF